MNTPFKNIVFREDPAPTEATITRAGLPRHTPGVIALRMSNGRELCLGLGGPALGLRVTDLHGLTEDEAREVIERHEAGALHKSVNRQQQKNAGAERWAAPHLSFNTLAGLGVETA